MQYNKQCERGNELLYWEFDPMLTYENCFFMYTLTHTVVFHLLQAKMMLLKLMMNSQDHLRQTNPRENSVVLKVILVSKLFNACLLVQISHHNKS